ncbi:uncharacterized protein LOC123452974 [Hordeum vulgare subsp. vulgare]|uniref:uncharacterized protein LOC123452974 n=1 Tax=Hordeum vulgare subsp. vulgare TaxID=112509 RepID=UPI001D1A5AB2|nr:uncharacterized protein LOC123452974 [Hordeum vulgare subsp. vulgare]
MLHVSCSEWGTAAAAGLTPASSSSTAGAEIVNEVVCTESMRQQQQVRNGYSQKKRTPHRPSLLSSRTDRAGRGRPSSRAPWLSSLLLLGKGLTAGDGRRNWGEVEEDHQIDSFRWSPRRGRTPAGRSRSQRRRLEVVPFCSCGD